MKRQSKISTKDFALRRLATCLVAVLLAGGGTLLVPDCACAADAPKPLGETKPFLDKALVARVSPGNLEEKGSSLLTSIDKAGHLDAIVFGEVARGEVTILSAASDI